MNKELGYYICNGKEFSSKAGCLIYATQVDKPIEWIFNKEVFDKFDFSHEPELTLDQLYDRRARELREKYDYLVLGYSGGSDSHNILMSFYRQGLHIDEVVSNWIFDASKTNFLVVDERVTDAWNQNAEFELTTKERLDWISINMPKTTITIYDSSRDTLTYYLKAKDESWVLDSRDALNPSGHVRYNFLHVRELRKRFDKQTNICTILGIDKPKFDIFDNKLYLRFHDKPANNVTINPQFGEYDNEHIEFFYWSPDACELLAKQSHTVLNYLKVDPKLKPIWESTNSDSIHSLREKILRDIIYSSTWVNRFQVDKPICDWDCEFDNWFYYSPQFEKSRAVWSRGVEYMQTNISTRFQTKNHRGIMPTIGSRHYIGNLS